MAANGKPNLLFLIADDHAGYVMGCAGNKMARTPNLDRLASEGVRFAAHHCNSPVCTPSRQSLLTGLYPHAAGVTTLQTPLDEGKTTLADLLGASGYRTAVFGKMHFNRPGQDGMHGLQTAMTEDRINKGWRAAVSGAPHPWQPFRTPAEQWLNADKQPQPFRFEEMRSTWATDRAKEWLTEHTKQADQPFAMWLSIQEPHSPFWFPRDDQNIFDPARFEVPKVGPEDAWQVPKIFQKLSPAQKQGIIAAYYTSAYHLDKNLGRMLDHLRATGQAENTLVVYMADHGYSLGHHGRFEKHCMYTPAMHVPLMMRFPGKLKPREVVRRRTEHVDVAPTLLRVLGAERLPKTHGRDLFNDPAREEIFVEYLENEEAALLWDRWKLVYTTGRRHRQDGYETDNPTPGKIVRLFDQKADPGEFTNVAAKHPALVETLTKKLEAKFQETHPEPGLALDDYLRPRDARK
ncbi:MAG: sulfatase-like hydrolase/transferase [Bryobacter sp.]|nr:sulfatase-like hydrolase/transferase [Bryobacter sp.]